MSTIGIYSYSSSMYGYGVDYSAAEEILGFREGESCLCFTVGIPRPLFTLLLFCDI